GDSQASARAYLSKPLLVGRDAELGKLRRSLDRARRGRGAALGIVAPPGLGRTRLLDAALLEASLAGLRTTRADASDAQDRPLGAVARILHGLHDDAREALERHGLTSVLSDGAALLEDARRGQTLRDLAKVLCELAGSSPLAIAVDDVHAIDEASLAVLASVALQVRGHALVLLSTRTPDAATRQSHALRLLVEASRRIPLEPLSADQARSLLSSLFGETPGLDVLAALCERRCLGSPRRLMESAQAAIDAGLARYEGGGWAISGDAAALGQALDRTTDIGQQLAALSEDAVELLEILALDRGDLMSLGDYTALTVHGDSARMHRALGELSGTEWLVVHGERARFRRDDQRLHLAARVAPATARRIHARLAERCEAIGAVPVYATYHYIQADLPERALAPMEAMTRYVDAHVSSEVVRSPITLEALERFVELPELPNAHPGARAHYYAALVVNAIYQGMPERAAPKIEIALSEFARFTGISDYREASHLTHTERLHFALTRANERCQAPGIGGLDLVHALRRQTQLCMTTAVCANFLAEPRLLDHLPDLRPFAALSPALGFAARMLDGLCKLARGQTWLASDTFAATYAQLAGAEGAAIDPVTLVVLLTSSLGYLCSIEAELGSPQTPAHLDAYAPHMPHNALSLRARYLLAIGDVAGAAAARKQSELASVQGNSLLETRNTETTGYLTIAALSDDLLGLRRAEADVAEVAKTRPGWQPRLAIAQSHVLRCEGRALEAVALAERALAQLPALHADFTAAAAAHLEALLAAGRSQAAKAAAARHLETAAAAGAPTYRLELAAAQAHAELAEHDAAELCYATALRALEARQASGLVLGRAFEIGARIAFLRGDAREFAARSESCASCYAVRHNAALAARHGRLVRDAMRVLPDAHKRPSQSADGMSSGTLRELGSRVDDDDFYANALAYLVKCSGAAGGYLYVCANDGVRRVAQTQGITPSEGAELDRMASEQCQAQDAPVDATQLESQARPARAIWPCVIARNDGLGRSIEGVVLFVSHPESGPGIPRANLEQLATLMTMRTAAATHVQPISTTVV
ncbi:MAG TPA: AAA family ATPase, partial [Polyangiales bacterium]|nr:AAA family ATPase [Polyangiales bacterium]